MKPNFNPKTNKISLDLDGVLADFDEYIYSNFFAKHPNIKELSDDDMWKYIASVDRFFFNLKPTPYAFELVEFTRSITPNVEVLTALPSNGKIPGSMQDKIDWVKLHWGDSLKVNFGPYSKDKWKHTNPGDILIDDRASNIEEWDKLGRGHAVLHFVGHFERTKELVLAVPGVQ